MNQNTDMFDPSVHRDRRKNPDRRKNKDRRSNKERRHDFRTDFQGPRRSFCNWLRSLINPRLGVDRRKKERRVRDRRQPRKNDILTQEEISDLLSH